MTYLICWRRYRCGWIVVEEWICFYWVCWKATVRTFEVVPEYSGLGKSRLKYMYCSSPGFSLVVCIFKIQSPLTHEKGNHQSCRSADPRNAMHQNLSPNISTLVFLSWSAMKVTVSSKKS